MKLKETFKKLCTPAKLYVAITIIACLFALVNGMTIIAVLVKLFFALIWTWFLSWLCRKGLTGISWILVLLPYIIILTAVSGIMYISKNNYTQNTSSYHMKKMN